MSEKRIAASTPIISTGWIVTSAASSAFCRASGNPSFHGSRDIRADSCPACRMIQIGVRSVACPLQARINNESLLNAFNMFDQTASKIVCVRPRWK